MIMSDNAVPLTEARGPGEVKEYRILELTDLPK